MIVICTMSEEDYKTLPHLVRSNLLYVEFKEEDEYNTHKDDKTYLELKKQAKKAKKELRDYLFEKRHK